MIRKKTKEELKALRESGKIAVLIMDKLCEAVRPGVSTGDLENLACSLMSEFGARPAQKNFSMGDGRFFPTALITAINDEVVHSPSLPSRVLNEGDIVSIDFVIEYPLFPRNNSLSALPANPHSKLGGYYVDLCRTLPVGKISEEAKKLLKATKESLYLGIDQVKPGNTLLDIAQAVQAHVELCGYSVIRDLVGHGVGYSLHEEPHIPNYAFGSEIKNYILEPGMVLAIEPMTAIGNYRIKEDKSGFAYRTHDGSLSAHFEHTVGVTEKGHVILTK